MPQRRVFALNYARTRDDRQWRASAELDLPYFDDLGGHL
jgi:hypothetical protein